MDRRTRNGLLLAITSSLSIVTGAVTFVGSLRFQVTAGAEGARPGSWPSGSALRRRSGRATVVLFAHPRCPCTRASLVQLGNLVETVQGRADAIVAFLEPEGSPADWVLTDSWLAATKIPGVTVVRDAAGREARRFGALTSGQAVVFDATGQLGFSGGITAARGSLGDNVGVRAALGALTGHEPERREWPVGGCPLFEVSAVSGGTQ